jgi:hypothetical protein
MGVVLFYDSFNLKISSRIAKDNVINPAREGLYIDGDCILRLKEISKHISAERIMNFNLGVGFEIPYVNNSGCRVRI